MVSVCKLGGTINQTGVKGGKSKRSKIPVSFFFLFSAPALLAVRGSPLTARSFARRSFDRSKNARERKKLLAVYFTHQNPMQICACAWIYRWTKNYGKSELGHGASGPPGRSGPRAGGPSGRRAAGPSRAAGQNPNNNCTKFHFSDRTVCNCKLKECPKSR